MQFGEHSSLQWPCYTYYMYYVHYIVITVDYASLQATAPKLIPNSNSNPTSTCCKLILLNNTVLHAVTRTS